MRECLERVNDVAAATSTATLPPPRPGKVVPRTLHRGRKHRGHLQRSRPRTLGRTRVTTKRGTKPGTSWTVPQALPTRKVRASNPLPRLRRARHVPRSLPAPPSPVRTALLSALWKELRRVSATRTTRTAPATSICSWVPSEGGCKNHPDPRFVDSALEDYCGGCYYGSHEESLHVSWCNIYPRNYDEKEFCY